MITDIGKNIVAKYLIGDAPAYASYMALGCGRKPRPNVTSLENVNTYYYSGSIVGNSVSGIITEGLVVGMSLTQVEGTGAFNGETTILSIDGDSQITVESEGINTSGTIVFYANSGSYSMLEVSDTNSLWEGAMLTQLNSFAGSLSTTQNTIVDKIISSTLIRVTPSIETETITEADLSITVDPSIKSLEFESLRVPITSRGYINDNGVNKIIMTAQLPSEERYEFTEIGIYSAGANRSAGAYDSKVISAFTEAEGWEISADNTVSGPSLTNPLFQEYDISIINSNNVITSEAPAIKLRASNGIFSNETRLERYERPRYLDNAYMLRGNTSFIYRDPDTSRLTIGTNPKFLQASGQIVDLSKNSSSDLLKIAFTLVSVDGDSLVVPNTVYLVLEFSNSDGSQTAKMEIEVTEENYDIVNNRYIVYTNKLEDLFYSSQFSWKTINTIKVYASVIKDAPVTFKYADGTEAELTTGVAHNLIAGDTVFIDGVGEGFDGIRVVTDVPTGTTFKFETDATAILQPVTPSGLVQSSNPDFYITVDAIRLDNINTINPLYGLVGYSIIQDDLQQTVVKAPNTTNYIEYRFVLDVT